MDFLFLGVMIGVMVGIFIGSETMKTKWIRNSWAIQRLCFDGIFYKVVNIEDDKSWENALIHKKEDKNA